MSDHSGRDASTVGRLIADRYELVAPLGTGGMAQVWAADDRLLSRRVAVKLLHRHLAADPDFVQRFRREAIAAARLVHPNIVAVYDTVSSEDCEAIVMELVDGITLRARLDADGPMSEATVRRLGADLAGALDCAHRNGIVHRDIKPANILLANDGSVRLADFGIAKGEEDPDLTVAGTLVGTAAYLAPEQVGDGRIDQRTDLYSLSTVLYEAVSGATPFRADSPAATALARLHQAPVDLADQVDGLSPAFTRAVMRNLERSPDRRFQSALDFGAALEDASGRGRRTGRTRPTPAPASSTASSTAAGPAGPAAVERASRHPARRRSVPGRILLALLVVGPLVLIGLLAAGDDDDAAPANDDPATTQSVELTVTAVAFDPMGDTQEENNDQAPLAVDDDPESAWNTEGYNAQTFGTKTGVGLVLRLDRPARLDEVVVAGSVGWKGRAYVMAADPSTQAGPPAEGGVAVDAATSPETVSLDGAVGSFVLLWIEDLGPASGRHRVSITDVTVTGRAEQ